MQKQPLSVEIKPDAGKKNTHKPKPVPELTLEQRIEQTLSKNGRYLVSEPFRGISNRVVRLFQYATVFMIIVILGSRVYARISAYPFTDYSSELPLLVVNFIASSVYLRVNNLEGPLNRREFDRWRWIQSRKRHLALATITMMVGLHYLLGVPTARQSEQHLFLQKLTVLYIPIVLTCVVLILLRPKLFSSWLILGIIETATTISLFFTLIYVVDIWFFVEISPLIVFPAVILVLSVLWYLRTYVKTRLHPFQEEMLILVGPERIFQAIRTKHQKLQDQLAAISLYSKLAEEVPLGVRAELLKLHANEYEEQKRRFWLLGVLIAILFYVLQAAGEPVVQKFFPILCWLNLTTCP